MSEVAIDDDAAETAPSGARSALLLVRRLVVGWSVVVVAVLGLAWVNITTGRVEGPSMEPTLTTGDTIIASKRSLPAFGDVVTADILLASGRPYPVVKRVLAIGGDVIAYDDCVLTRNGRVVAEPYLDPSAPSRNCGDPLPPTVVPPGHVWLMGDNRAASIDSRFYGWVPLDQVRGVMIIAL